MIESTPAVGEVELSTYPLWRRGKVRDIFDADDRLLFVATDRVSAFDVILPDLLPGKGRVLTAISDLWFDVTRDVLASHRITTSINDLDLTDHERTLLAGRTMQVRRAERIDIECVVRGALAGSGWEEYRHHGTLAGESLASGLALGSTLAGPRFTPALKNDAGHDENISRARLSDEVGMELATTLERASLAVFSLASAVAERAGFRLADSKFEFGHIDGELVLIDEVLTPDSSRYWDAASLVPGSAPDGFDKQVIRDWLLTTDWNREPPAPHLPADILRLSMKRYDSVLQRLTIATGNQGDYTP